MAHPYTDTRPYRGNCPDCDGRFMVFLGRLPTHGACAVCGVTIVEEIEPHWRGWLDLWGDQLSYVPTLHDHVLIAAGPCVGSGKRDVDSQGITDYYARCAAEQRDSGD